MLGTFFDPFFQGLEKKKRVFPTIGKTRSSAKAARDYLTI